MCDYKSCAVQRERERSHRLLHTKKNLPSIHTFFSLWTRTNYLFLFFRIIYFVNDIIIINKMEMKMKKLSEKERMLDRESMEQRNLWKIGTWKYFQLDANPTCSTFCVIFFFKDYLINSIFYLCILKSIIKVRFIFILIKFLSLHFLPLSPWIHCLLAHFRFLFLLIDLSESPDTTSRVIQTRHLLF